jgi:alpha-1,2-mannosyltransferase
MKLDTPNRAQAVRPHPLRDRLWLGGLGATLFLVALVVGTHVANPRNSLLTGAAGDDFLPSYMAGAFVREGRSDWLMDLDQAARFQAETRRTAGLAQHGRTGPWLNPPFYAWLFAPLAGMPYPSALKVWLAFNLLCLTASVVLLCRMLRGEGTREVGWKTWGLVPLLVVCSMPFLQAMACQQNTFLSLLILTATATLWRARRALPAGLVAGLLFFKPQLGVLVAAALCLSLGRRAVLGLFITGASLLLVSVLTMPGALEDYLAKLPELVPSARAGTAYAWERQITFHGFWRMLLQGREGGPAVLEVTVLGFAWAAALGVCLGPALLRALRGQAPDAPPDRLIAAAVTAMPLMMPYYMDYDLLLLAVPAVLFAADVCRRGAPMHRLNKWITGVGLVLFPWLFFNAAYAGDAGVNFTVLLLAAVAVMLAARAALDENGAANVDAKDSEEDHEASLSAAA